MPQFSMIFLPVPHPIADENGMITRPWLLQQQDVVTALTNTGDVIGPASSFDNQIVLFDGTSGHLIKGATGTGFVFATNGVYSVVADISTVGYWSELTNGDPVTPELVFAGGDTIDVWVPTP